MKRLLVHVGGAEYVENAQLYKYVAPSAAW